MKKLLIVLWFGKFPNYFELYLDSCSHNRSWNWMIFTDQDVDEYSVPENVEIVRTRFSEIKARICKCLKVNLSNKAGPYKLCDFRPFYGYIFSHEINGVGGEGYEYWGHCDIDVIWGNLSKFYPDEIIRQYDRFLIWGHLTMYRNTPDNNEMFRRLDFKNVNYKIIVNSKYNWAIDEYSKYSLLRIQEKLDCYQIYRDRDAIADIAPYDGYQICDGAGYIAPSVMSPSDYVRVEPGAIYIKRSKDEAEEEKAYAHFQKRDFDILPLNDDGQYYVLSNTICTDKDYKGRVTIKKSNRKWEIKRAQCGKILEIIFSRYRKNRR